MQFDEIRAEKEKLNMINFLNQIEIEKDLNTDYKTLRFLRCAAIFDHFARSCKIIDWDEILSSKYLCNFFNAPDAFKKYIKPGENIDHASDAYVQAHRYSEKFLGFHSSAKKKASFAFLLER